MLTIVSEDRVKGGTHPKVPASHEKINRFINLRDAHLLPMHGNGLKSIQWHSSGGCRCGELKAVPADRQPCRCIGTKCRDTNNIVSWHTPCHINTGLTSKIGRHCRSGEEIPKIRFNSYG